MGKQAKRLSERLRVAAGFALMDAARQTVLEAAEELERQRAAIEAYRAAIETAGLVFRNTDSGPSLVRLPESG